MTKNVLLIIVFDYEAISFDFIEKLEFASETFLGLIQNDGLLLGDITDLATHVERSRIGGLKAHLTDSVWEQKDPRIVSWIHRERIRNHSVHHTWKRVESSDALNWNSLVRSSTCGLSGLVLPYKIEL